MNPQAGLQLRDIQLPEPVSWWPPAPGWWLLLLAGVLLVSMLVVLIRWLKKPRLQRQARRQVLQVLNEFSGHGDQSRLFRDLSITLRRIGISFYPREQVAGLIGEHWFEQLNRLSASPSLSRQTVELLQTQPYRREQPLSTQQLEPLLQQIRQWALSIKGV